MSAPVIKLAEAESRKATASATSDGKPTRRKRWKGAATRSAFARSSLVNYLVMLLQVQPGDTVLTLMPSGARSSAWLRVSCRIAAFEAG